MNRDAAPLITWMFVIRSAVCIKKCHKKTKRKVQTGRKAPRKDKSMLKIIYEGEASSQSSSGGVWELHLLISRPQVYPIDSERPRGGIKACVIQWLLNHPQPVLPLRSLAAQTTRKRANTKHWPGPVYARSLHGFPGQEEFHFPPLQLHLHSTLHSINFHLTTLAWCCRRHE